MPWRPVRGMGMGMPSDQSPQTDGAWVFFQFRADGAEVRCALQQVQSRLRGQLAPDDVGALELALAEVLNNIIEHAYAGQVPGQVSVSVARSARDNALVCRIEDDGQPMPGLTLPEGRMQPVADRTEDLAEGGWGWALIRALTRDISYRRSGNRNHLQFHLPLTA